MSPLELALGAAALGSLAGGRAARQQVWGYINGKPELLELVEVGVDAKGQPLLLRWDAAEAWGALRAAAAAEGVDLQLNSAFRYFEQQQALRALYEAGKGALAAPAGYSNHQGGVAVDVETEGGSNRAFVWLNVNAARFNFKRTVPAEPWHWEFRP